MRKILCNYFEFGLVVQGGCHFKDISYLELLWPYLFGGADSGRGHHEEIVLEK